MPEDPLEVVTAFMVIVQKDGNIGIATSAIPSLTVDREATLEDLERACQHVAASAGRAILVRSLVPQQPPAPSAVVADALRKRMEEDA